MSTCRHAGRDSPRILMGRHGAECPLRLAETGLGATQSPDGHTDLPDPEIGAQRGSDA